MRGFLGALFVRWDVIDADVVSVVRETEGDGFAAESEGALEHGHSDHCSSRKIKSSHLPYMPRAEPVTIAVRDPSDEIA